MKIHMHLTEKQMADVNNSYVVDDQGDLKRFFFNI